MTENLRIYMINGSVMGLASFSQIEDWLKIILLIVTIGYTTAKWVKVEIDKKEKKEDE
jgi:hypothetical protein|tara:strand:- start:103 stop:276 length:174 start_codon:yes stop_codon:yes gene_type:complete